MIDSQGQSETKLRFGFRIRKSPYFEASRRAGSTHYSVYNHMYYPVQYGNPQEDNYRAVQLTTGMKGFGLIRCNFGLELDALRCHLKLP